MLEMGQVNRCREEDKGKGIGQGRDVQISKKGAGKEVSGKGKMSTTRKEQVEQTDVQVPGSRWSILVRVSVAQ